MQVLTDAHVTEKTERLRRLVAAGGVSDLDVTVKLTIGKPHDELARMVRENQHDLVIKPFTGRSAMQYLSVMQKDCELIRSCPCPLWLVNVAERDDNNCILAALDMSAEGDSEERLNRHIVNIASSIAAAECRPLHFVHAWSLPGERNRRARCTPATDLEVDRMLAHEASMRKTWLQNRVGRPRSEMWCSASEKITPELHVVKGHANKEIPDLAEKLGAELIILGSVAPTAVSDSLRKNTAEKILPRTDCSFLVVTQPEPTPFSAVRAQPALPGN